MKLVRNSINQDPQSKEAIDVVDEATKRLVSFSDPAIEYIYSQGGLLPSGEWLRHIVGLVRSLLFPAYFGKAPLGAAKLEHYTRECLTDVLEHLTDQIQVALSYAGYTDKAKIQEQALAHSLAFIRTVPEVRRILVTDARATFENDPAAKSFEEVILCYPAFRAMINHRIAHELVKAGVPLIPRMISEFAHSDTGIDIHPGARIGEFFCIDHGTGVVIGETCVIGSHVRLYQGVTLGAKRFSLDDDGHPLKDEPRHPIIEDNVVIYSNATLLGRITVGRDSVIGGNVWITHDVAPGSRITQAKTVNERYLDGLGI